MSPAPLPPDSASASASGPVSRFSHVIRGVCGPLMPLVSTSSYSNLASRAASVARASVAPLVPAGRYARRVGRGVAHEAFFAGVATHAHAQRTVGQLVLGAGQAGQFGRTSVQHLTRLTGPTPRPGSFADRAASVVRVGAFIAVETYPLWMSFIRMAHAQNPAFSPSDTQSINLSPLSIDQALIVSGQGSIDHASSRLSKLAAKRQHFMAQRTQHLDNVSSNPVPVSEGLPVSDGPSVSDALTSSCQSHAQDPAYTPKRAPFWRP